MKYKKIYVKITTLPQTEELDVNSLEYQVYKDKYKEAREFVSDKEGLGSYYSEASKNPSFGVIYSITVGFLKDRSTLRVKTLKGNEDEILKDFLKLLNSQGFIDSKLVTYNLSFTLSFLTIRMLKNKMDISSLPKQLVNLGLKPWNIKDAVGMSEMLNGISWFKQNMLELAYLSGLHTDFILGEDIYSYFKAGKIEEIDGSDVKYLQNICNLDRITEGKELIEEVSVSKESEKTEVKPVGVLERIYLNNKISGQDKKELREILKGKALTKKNREILIDMIYNLSINSDFMNKDKPEVKKEKLETVVELIKNL